MSAIPYPYLLLKLLYVRLLSLKMEVVEGEMCQSVFNKKCILTVNSIHYFYPCPFLTQDYFNILEYTISGVKLWVSGKNYLMH